MAVEENTEIDTNVERFYCLKGSVHSSAGVNRMRMLLYLIMVAAWVGGGVIIHRHGILPGALVVACGFAFAGLYAVTSKGGDAGYFYDIPKGVILHVLHVEKVIKGPDTSDTAYAVLVRDPQEGLVYSFCLDFEPPKVFMRKGEELFLVVKKSAAA